MDKKNKPNSSVVIKKPGNFENKTNGKKIDHVEKSIKIQNNKGIKPTILGKDGGGGHSKK